MKLDDEKALSNKTNAELIDIIKQLLDIIIEYEMKNTK